VLVHRLTRSRFAPVSRRHEAGAARVLGGSLLENARRHFIHDHYSQPAQ
jgi:hypothetical protein